MKNNAGYCNVMCFRNSDALSKNIITKTLFADGIFLKRGKERVLVYSTKQQLQLLFSGEIIFIDGTFGIAPDGCEKVFLIHVEHFGQRKSVIYFLIYLIVFLFFIKRFAGRVLSDAESTSSNV